MLAGLQDFYQSSFSLFFFFLLSYLTIYTLLPFFSSYTLPPPSCLSVICLVITSYMLQVWTQIIRAERLGRSRQRYRPSNLLSDRRCFASPLRHPKESSLSPSFIVSLSSGLLCLCHDSCLVLSLLSLQTFM